MMPYLIKLQMWYWSILAIGHVQSKTLLPESLPVRNHAPVAELISAEKIPFASIDTFPVKVSCKSDVPFDSCTFKRNGQHLSTGDRDLDERYFVSSDSTFCILTISNATSSDNGEYQCLLSNDLGASLSPSAELVYAPLAHQDSTDLTFSTQPGQSVIMPCSEPDQSQNSAEFLNYKWSISSGLFFKVDTPIEDSSTKYHVLPDGSLAILDVSRDDDGTKFVCTQSIDYQDYKLDVKSSKKILKISDTGQQGLRDLILYPKLSNASIEITVTAIEGKMFHLRALFASQSKVQWKFANEDLEVYSEANRRQDGRVLHFESIDRRNQGRYEAYIEDNPELRIVYVVLVDSLPKMVKPLSSHVVPLNSSVDFECKTVPQSSQLTAGPDSVPLKNTHEWFINGERAENGPDITITGNTLQVDSIYNSFSAQCKVTNGHGSILETSVVVVASPTVSYLSDAYTNSFEAGANLYIALRCPIEYDPNLVPQIKWYREGEQLPVGPKYKMDPESGSLMFHTAKDDGGNYTCQIDTPFDEASATTQLVINPNLSGPYLGPWWLIIVLMILCFVMTLIIICLMCCYIRGRRIYNVVKSEQKAGRNSRMFDSMRSARNYSMQPRGESSHVATESYQMRVPY